MSYLVESSSCCSLGLQDNISTLKNIVDLDLSKNQLTELPESFGELVHLQRLDLFENKLTELPLSFAGLEKLRWLDLKENPLSQGLAKAAGPCLSEPECKQCAKNVRPSLCPSYLFPPSSSSSLWVCRWWCM